MKYSIFWIFIFTIVTTFSCSAIPQDKLEFLYTGIPDLYVELSEVHLLDINGIKYSAYVNQDFRLSEITILMSGELIGVAGKCLQNIHFPDLQTLKVSKSVRKEDLKIYATIFKMEFHYFGNKDIALSENAELQDWVLKLQINDDLSGRLDVESNTRKLSLECEVTRTKPVQPN